MIMLYIKMILSSLWCVLHKLSFPIRGAGRQLERWSKLSIRALFCCLGFPRQALTCLGQPLELLPAPLSVEIIHVDTRPGRMLLLHDDMTCWQSSSSAYLSAPAEKSRSHITSAIPEASLPWIPWRIQPTDVIGRTHFPASPHPCEPRLSPTVILPAHLAIGGKPSLTVTSSYPW